MTCSPRAVGAAGAGPRRARSTGSIGRGAGSPAGAAARGDLHASGTRCAGRRLRILLRGRARILHARVGRGARASCAPDLGGARARGAGSPLRRSGPDSTRRWRSGEAAGERSAGALRDPAEAAAHFRRALAARARAGPAGERAATGRGRAPPRARQVPYRRPRLGSETVERRCGRARRSSADAPARRLPGRSSPAARVATRPAAARSAPTTARRWPEDLFAAAEAARPGARLPSRTGARVRPLFFAGDLAEAGTSCCVARHPRRPGGARAPSRPRRRSEHHPQDHVSGRSARLWAQVPTGGARVAGGRARAGPAPEPTPSRSPGRLASCRTLLRSARRGRGGARSRRRRSTCRAGRPLPAVARPAQQGRGWALFQAGDAAGGLALLEEDFAVCAATAALLTAPIGRCLLAEAALPAWRGRGGVRLSWGWHGHVEAEPGSGICGPRSTGAAGRS